MKEELRSKMMVIGMVISAVLGVAWFVSIFVVGWWMLILVPLVVSGLALFVFFMFNVGEMIGDGLTELVTMVQDWKWERESRRRLEEEG